MLGKFSVRVMAEIAIFAAIAVALDLVQGAIFGSVWVNGGSIGIAMVPILVISYRRGLLPGLLCGLVVAVVSMMGGVYVIQGATFKNEFMKTMGPFLQIMMDYILAFTLVGVAGAFAGLYHKSNSKQAKIIWVSVGSIVAGTIKMIMHILAGGFFWLTGYDVKHFGKADSWSYSIIYNASYGIPNIILCTVVMVMIVLFYSILLEAKEGSKKVEQSVFEEVKTNE